MTVLPSTDVLVIGAGPTGLTLACDLARRGVAHRIIDQGGAFSVASRAKTVMPRALEVADDLGFVADILAIGVVDMPARFYGPDGGAVDRPGVAVAAGPELATPYPDPIWIAEFDVEAAMRARHGRLGGHVELDTTATDLHQDADGVLVTVQTALGTGSIRARWVVAADGGKSRTRRLIDAPLVGTTYDRQRWYLGDVHLDGLDRGRMHIWTSPEGMLGLTPLPHTDVWQLQATIPADVSDPKQPSLELYQAMLERRAGVEDLRLTDASWLSIYRTNVRMVDHYRNRRVLLAGDAAHVHSPAGGQGMNTGIQDAYNLGWKLAAVLGGADDSLLDTYDEERRPVARAVLDDSTDKMGAVTATVTNRAALTTSLGRVSDDLTSGLLFCYRFSSLSQPAARPDALGPRPGDRAPDATGLHGAAFRGSLFDLFRGPHWTVLAFTEGDEPTLDGLSGPGVELHRIRWYDTRAASGIVDGGGTAYAVYAPEGDEVVLVRPDGYLAARTALADASAIRTYLDETLSLPG